MAKLQDVKVIDMVDGEVTKVAYGDEEFELTEEKAQVGDVLFNIVGHEEQLEDSYYKVVEIDDFARVLDEEGEANGWKHHLQGNFFKVYRSVAKEEEQYREISRDAQVGDFLKFEDDEDIPSYLPNTEYHEIVEIDWNDDPHILDDDGDNYDTWTKDFTVYEKVSEQTDGSVAGESIEGRTVKVTKCLVGNREGYAGFSYSGQGVVAIGSIGEVREEVTGGIYVRFDADTTDHAKYSDIESFFLADGEYEVIGNGRIVEGDYVVAKDSADDAYGITNTDMVIGRVEHIRGDGSMELAVLGHSDEFEIGNTYDVECVYFEKAPESVTEDYLRSQLKEGYKVRLLNGGNEYPLFGFTDGGIYEVVNTSHSHDHYDPINAVAIGNHGGGFALPSQLELVTESTDEVDKAKKGDLIRITDKSRSITMTDMKEGKVYKVVAEVLPNEYFANIIDEEGQEASAIDGGYEVVTYDLDAVKEYFATGSKVQIDIPEDENTEYGRDRITNDVVGVVVRVRERSYEDEIIVEINFPSRASTWNGSPEELTVVEVAEEEVETSEDADTIIVGKTYVTTKDGFFGDIPKGTKVFSDGDVNSRGHRVFLMDESDFDRVEPEHLTEVEETEEDDEPKVGDIVRVTGSDFGHPVGTIGEVVPAPEYLGTDVAVLANGQRMSHIDKMEIICRKEDRIDV